ncbi:unnamed protein product [Larinioides sclopetarius]|uniref:Uncharacterized protein n=1 Tax=Larinioides sclopetarius TaxID=280406 RepID=A0AAV2BS61_9ARAC
MKFLSSRYFYYCKFFGDFQHFRSHRFKSSQIFEDFLLTTEQITVVSAAEHVFSICSLVN